MFTTALEIHQWLVDDQTTPFRQRQQRDEAIGREVLQSQPQIADGELVMAWWLRVRAGDSGLSAPHIDAGRRWLHLVVTLLGVVSGAGITAVALTYTGDYPVNLLPLLGILVGIPSLFLLCSLLGGLLNGLGMGAFTRNFAVYQRGLLSWFDRWAGTRLHYLVGHRDAYGRAAYWLLQSMSQRMAIAFYIAALTMAMLLIAFTDIAFGWSTTLDLSPTALHAVFEMISAPWRSWLPVAVPSAELVEVSRYFRLGQQFADVDVQRLGQWWPFVLACLVCWGLLPRILVLVIARLRLGQAAGRMLVEHNEVTALLDRLRTAHVEFVADVRPGATGTEPAAVLHAMFWVDTAVTVSWNQAQDSGEALPVSAGQSPDERLAVFSEIPSNPAQVVVLTKGWEPPVFEFTDMLSELRAALGSQPSIVVVPLALADENLSDDQLAVWQHAMLGVGDHRLYVARSGQETAS